MKTDSDLYREMYTSLTSTLITNATRHQLETATILWRQTREARLRMERQAEAIRHFETGLKSWIVEVFKGQEQEGVLIDGRITSLTTRPQATVEDKEKFLKHIRETGELDLLQYRLSTSAVDLRKEDGKEVPGVIYIDVYDLSDKAL